ncbi:DUF4352 domain-containing protein [Halobacillus sp. Marseille-Q1614]|uniref:DUF4352 domain-containing protein n=1 Tax=Halobacillus sp. Marseille-Q1614 TaxID=2709134 RepID=UPI00156EF4DE|nr:DUF4352 domain-containing protein [Halobacillus sp. Marseille-Q1614]
MKKIFKFGLYAFLAIIVLGVVATVFGGEDTAESTDSEPASAEAEGSESKEASKDESSDEAEEKTYGIGDTVEVGAMTYTINEKSTADEVGPSVMPETASGKYVVLNVTVKNNGDEAVTVDGTYFKLKQNDKTFEADTMASTSANQAEDGSIENSFFLEQLNPGSEISGNVVFDVAPEIADADDLSVEAQEGIFGTVTETITLQ